MRRGRGEQGIGRRGRRSRKKGEEQVEKIGEERNEEKRK
jgi:hypothetical protein